MPISANKVILVGRLGADPEQPSNGPVKMRLATSETWKDKGGERQERTSWHQVVVWNEPAGRFAMQYLKKGDLVYVEGSVETRRWDKDDGSSQYITEIVVRPFTGVIQAQSQNQSGSGGYEDRGGGRERSQSRSTPGSDRYSRPSSDMDDEIPF